MEGKCSEAGKLCQIILLDITALKEVSYNLEQSNNRYKSLFLNNHTVMLIIDPETGSIVDANPIACSYYGWSYTEICQKNIADINTLTPDEIFFEMNLAKEEKRKHFFFKHRLASGEIREVEVHSGPISYGNKEMLYSHVQDITERKLMERALRDSEEKFSVAFKSSPYIITISGLLDGKFVEVNDAFSSVTGFSREEAIGYSALEIGLWINAEVRDNWAIKLQRSRSVNDIETQIRGKNGQIIDVLYSVTTIKINGKEDYILASIEDITDRKRTQNALQHSEIKYRTLVENINDVLFEVDQTGIIKYISSPIYKILGYTSEEITGRNFTDFVGDISGPLLNRLAILDEKSQLEVEYQIFKKSGEPCWVRISTKKIIENGVFLGGSGTLIDITGRKLTEEALHKSSQKWEAILSTSADGIGMVSLDGKIQLLSDKIAAMYGYSSDEKEQYIGGSFMEFIDSSCHSRLIDNIQRLLEGNKDIKVTEYIAVKKDKSRFDVELNSTVLRDSEGKPESILYFQRDITERKVAENILKESERKFKLIIQSQAEGIGVVNQDEFFEFVNPAAATIFETTVDELVKTSLLDYLSDGEIEKINNQTSSRRNGVTNKYELQIFTKAGNSKFIEVSSSPKFDENNNYAGAYGVFRDITDRKLAQEALKEKTTLLSNLIINMQEGILLENSRRQIVLTNQLFCNMFAIPAPPEAMVGADCSDSAGQSKHLFKDPEKFVAVIQKILSDKVVILNDELELADGRYFERDYIPTYLDNAYNGHLWKYRDITNRKLSEQKINQQNERLNAIVTAMPDLIFVMDQYGNSSEYYANTPDILPVSEDKVVGVNVEDLFDKEAAQFHLQMINECIEQKRLVSYVYHVTSTNSPGYYEARLVPLGIDKVLAFIRDVSEKKQKEDEIQNLNATLELRIKERTAQLSESERSYKTVLENIKEIIFQTDADGLWLFLNKSWEEVTGFTVEESLGQLFVNYVHPDDRQRNMDLFHPLIMREKDYCRHQVRYLTKEGGFRWIEVFARLGLNERDEITGTYGTLQDITERKEAEDNLKQLSFRLALAVQAGGVGVWELDIVNNRLVWDDQMLALYGIKEGDFAGAYSAWLAGVHPDDRERGDEDIQNALTGIKEFDTEFRVLWPDGSIHNIRALAVVHRDNAGHPLQMIGTNWDITAQKRTEEEIIRARNEAEKANLAKSEFLSRMSHELRTPMNSILGFAQLMDMGDLIPAHKKGVKHILNSGRHLLNLINEVLDLSRIEAGMLSLSLEPVGINSVIVEMIDMVQPLANARRIELCLINLEGDYLFAKSDRQSLRQVLLNLLNNAVKYNREGGSILVKTEIKTQNVAGIIPLRISITDTGYGISSEDISKLFKPFVRVGAGKNVTEGTGLGLALVKKLMDAMGGTIGVESTIGEGTTFWLELPLCNSQIEESQSSIGLPRDDKFDENQIGTVLYIEDNSSNIELVEQILLNGRKNIRLIANPVGAGTLEMAIQYIPDLILLDLDLPDMHGSEVIEALQTDVRTKSIPVVIISADAMPAQINKLMKAGAGNYLTKPLDVMEFLKIIDMYVYEK